MRKTFKNFLSLLLTLSMVFSLVGYVPVMAEGGIVDDMEITVEQDNREIPAEDWTPDDTKSGSSEENDSYEGESKPASEEEEVISVANENETPYSAFAAEETTTEAITGTITEDAVWENGAVIGDVTISGNVTITVKGTVTVTGTIRLSPDSISNVTFNGEENATLIRGGDFTGQMFYAEGVSGNFHTLTINDIILDGGAVWTGDVDKTLNRGTTNEGVKATGSVLYLLYTNATLNNSTIAFNDSVVRNNNSPSTYWRGGVVTVREGGTATTDNAEVYGNSGAADSIYYIVCIVSDVSNELNRFAVCARFKGFLERRVLFVTNLRDRLGSLDYSVGCTFVYRYCFVSIRYKVRICTFRCVIRRVEVCECTALDYDLCGTVVVVRIDAVQSVTIVSEFNSCTVFFVFSVLGCTDLTAGDG